MCNALARSSAQCIDVCRTWSAKDFVVVPGFMNVSRNFRRGGKPWKNLHKDSNAPPPPTWRKGSTIRRKSSKKAPTWEKGFPPHQEKKVTKCPPTHAYREILIWFQWGRAPILWATMHTEASNAYILGEMFGRLERLASKCALVVWHLNRYIVFSALLLSAHSHGAQCEHPRGCGAYSLPSHCGSKLNVSYILE